MTDRQPVIAASDGCRSGWFCLTRSLATGEISARLFPNAEQLLRQEPRPAVLAIDIPVGLPDAGSRNCDLLARQILGKPRSCSVFPAAIRPALVASTRDEASAITFEADGRKVGVQSWGILAKIRDVDQVLRHDAESRRFTREVHPEVSFWKWNQERSMGHPKKHRAGREERLSLVSCYFGETAFPTVRPSFTRAEVASDDILDTFAALWTAERIFNGSAQSLPESPPVDSVGLPMEIVY